MKCCVPTATDFVCNKQVTPVDRLLRPAKVESQGFTLPVQFLSITNNIILGFFERLGAFRFGLAVHTSSNP